MSKKLFIGRKLRQIREGEGLTQARFAASLGISTSYLNQIENNQRHVTAPVIIALAETFGVDIASLSDSDADRLLVDLSEVFSDPLLGQSQPSRQELKLAVNNAPDVARAVIALHRKLRRSNEMLVEMGDVVSSRGDGRTAYDQVRDYFHYKDNYIDALDQKAEELAAKLGAGDLGDWLEGYLRKRHKVQVRYDLGRDDQTVRLFDATSKVIRLNPRLSSSGRSFQLAHQIAIFEHVDLIGELIDQEDFESEDARSVCRVSLANYFAGAVVMPYERFRLQALAYRHDLTRLCDEFDASLEQVMHRLSTLQRPSARGVPFFFARVDQAGNITKRHSATQLQFARFGSACPLWNVHSAFERPGEILRQLAETPDGARYLCLATMVTKSGTHFREIVPRHALALGCDVRQADKVVYADDLPLDRDSSFAPIGVSCRLCDRDACAQRSVPPLNRHLKVNWNQRRIVPYDFE